MRATRLPDALGARSELGEEVHVAVKICLVPENGPQQGQPRDAQCAQLRLGLDEASDRPLPGQWRMFHRHQSIALRLEGQPCGSGPNAPVSSRRRVNASARSARLRSYPSFHRRSAIRIAPVTHRCDVDDPRGIVDLVEHSAIANADPPDAFFALHLPATGRAWLAAKRLDPSPDARHQLRFERPVLDARSAQT